MSNLHKLSGSPIGCVISLPHMTKPFDPGSRVSGHSVPEVTGTDTSLHRDDHSDLPLLSIYDAMR